MTEHNDDDPLSVLHDGDLPVTPDPAFAARLRERLESAVNVFEAQPHRTRGVEMSGTETAIAELNEPNAPTAAHTVPRPAALPYLAVAGARDAIAWYLEAFGATLVGEPMIMDDGRVGHAELALAGGVFYLADEFPEIGLKAPAPQGVSVSLMLAVADTDAALERARTGGADVQREAYESHGSRSAAIIDPFGHRWMLSGPMTGAATIQHGDVGFVSVWTPDEDRAKAFYGHVLGWTYQPGSHRVAKAGLHAGVFAGDGSPDLFCCYAVTDVAAARQSILSGGGQVGDVDEREFGLVVDATDPWGTAFAVYQPTPGQPRPALNGVGPGDLSYLTYEVADSAAFREFYGRVLGWTFEPGRIDDGWQIAQAHPMAGVAGGSTSNAAVPMWIVAAIDTAIARVREAGGMVIDEPSQQSYGKSALCTDDQGSRFYLGEH
jgi:predicted enzyme related to lactoylglutathione lyase